MGVRGINLGEGDQVIALSILTHSDATPAERIAFLKMRRASADEAVEPEVEETEEGAETPTQLDAQTYGLMEQAEQIILTISANGYGKRTSSFEYRVTGRGGKGIVAMAVNARNGDLVASMPVETSDQIMLVTDGGQLIRCPVAGIRVVGRGTQGVIVFNTAEREKVVSVERIGEVENGDGEAEGEGDEAGPGEE
jgi:DNA gyrase subunit A